MASTHHLIQKDEKFLTIAYTRTAISVTPFAAAKAAPLMAAGDAGVEQIRFAEDMRDVWYKDIIKHR